MSDRGRSRRTFVLIFIVCCHAVGLLVFCQGFLLKRVEIPEYSQCRPHSRSTVRQDSSFGAGDRIHPSGAPISCTGYPKRFKRVLWLLIDALRYDFLVYDDRLDPTPPVYRNKLPFVRDLLRERPENAKLFKSIADAPTTTMQRLKALATGGLPTFIDIGSNFNSYEIQEDNLIYQARMHSRNVTFMGDDTWLGLYPGMFSKVFDYPSLNVKDLHTVDNGVISHLQPELALKDADFIIAHFLGVDHVGHTYGPSHWTMGDKLTQMNDVIKSVLTSLDEDTLVFVLGDHGMTSTGDHGGETEMETDAALLIYSPRPIFNPHQLSERSINQIDIIPTVAMTLGIPIPFSSLGMIIPEVFLPYQGSDSDSKNSDESLDDGFSGRVTMEFLVALQENALQIQKYLTTYAKHSDDFPSDIFQSLQGDLNRVLELHKKLVERESVEPSQKDLTDVAAAYVGYMKEVKVMCQSIWAKFDDVSITEGLTLLLLSVTVVPLMLIDVESGVTALRQALPYGAMGGLGVTAILALFSNIVQLELTFSGIISLVLALSFHSLAASIVIFILFFSPAIFQSLKDLLRSRQRLLSFVDQLSVLQLLSIAVTILYGVAMLSNSFVLYEADMVNFFLQSLLVCFAIRSLQIEFSNETNLVLDKATLNRVVRTAAPHVGAMVCVRLVKIFYACRDLQVQDGCVATTFIHALPVAYEFLGEWLAYSRMALSCAAVVSVPVGFLLLVQKSAGARHLNQWLLFVAKYGFLLAVLCVCGFWVLLCLPQTDLEDLAWWKHVTLPRIVYLVSAVAMVLCVVMPLKRGERVLTMNCEENPTNNADMTSTLNDGARNERNFPTETETQGPRLRRSNLHHTHPDDSFSQDTIRHVLHPSLTALIPLTNLFLLVALWIPVALLLNDSIALSAVIMAAQVALTIKGLKDKESGSSWPVCVLWGLMSFQFFFGFGHHAIVTSLRFEAGFVGLHGEIHTYNLPIAGALVGLNTLASQLLFGLGLPLLLFLNPSQPENPKKAPSNELFKIILQYITFHSIKMVVTVLAASIHRRHLMVWWVFAPRFMYEGAFQMTADICSILSYLFVCRLENLLSYRYS